MNVIVGKLDDLLAVLKAMNDELNGSADGLEIVNGLSSVSIKLCEEVLDECLSRRDWMK